MFKFLISPYGRTSRGGYWAFIAGVVLASFGGMAADRYFGTYNAELDTGIFETAIGVLLFWPSIAVSVRRFHDRNMTGWWNLILAVATIIAGLIGAAIGVALTGADLANLENVPESQAILIAILGAVGILLVAIYWFVVQLVLPGKPGDNKYGPNPLER